MPMPLASGPPAIAVLPFTSLGGDADLDVFGDGLVEGITAALSRVRSFFVISRSSTQKYRGQPIDAAVIGGELGVRYLLLGSLQRAGPRIRVRAELVETSVGAMLWSETHDGALEDAFDLQDRITERICGAIAPSVRMAEIERARRKRPENLVAYDYVMRALPQMWAMTHASNAEALRLCYEAIRLDPNYALGYAHASWCHFWSFANNWTESMEASHAEAMRLIHMALRLDSNDPAVLSIAALSETAIRHDLRAASTYIEKALELDPNFSWAWNRSGYIQVYRDRTDTALEHFARAERLSPFCPLNFNRYVGTALAHYCADRFEEAVQFAEQARTERPGLPWAYRVLTAAHVQLGQMAQAQAAVAVLLRDSPGLSIARVMDAMPFERADICQRFADGLRAAGMPE
jgi:adenylate cyclase